MNITNSDAEDGSEAQILVSGRRRSCFQVIYKNNLMFFSILVDTIKIERCVETPTTASQGKRMVVRILNIELNYLTVDFCFRSSHVCSMLAIANVIFCYIFEAPYCLFACFAKTVVLVGKNKNSGAFHPNPAEKIVLY